MKDDTTRWRVKFGRPRLPYVYIPSREEQVWKTACYLQKAPHENAPYESVEELVTIDWAVLRSLPQDVNAHEATRQLFWTFLLSKLDLYVAVIPQTQMERILAYVSSRVPMTDSFRELLQVRQSLRESPEKFAAESAIRQRAEFFDRWLRGLINPLSSRRDY